MMEEELRLKALKAARSEGVPHNETIARAEEIYQWLRYGADGATQNRRALAGEVVAPRTNWEGVELLDAEGNARLAKVVGRDKELLDRLRNADGYQKDE